MHCILVYATLLLTEYISLVSFHFDLFTFILYCHMYQVLYECKSTNEKELKEELSLAEEYFTFLGFCKTTMFDPDGIPLEDIGFNRQCGDPYEKDKVPTLHVHPKALLLHAGSSAQGIEYKNIGTAIETSSGRYSVEFRGHALMVCP